MKLDSCPDDEGVKADRSIRRAGARVSSSMNLTQGGGGRGAARGKMAATQTTYVTQPTHPLAHKRTTLQTRKGAQMPGAAKRCEPKPKPHLTDA
jgi:hypothetical protein